MRRLLLVLVPLVPLSVAGCSSGESKDDQWALAQEEADDDFEQCLLGWWDEAFTEAYNLMEDRRYGEAMEVIDFRDALGSESSMDFCLDRKITREDDEYESIYGEPRGG